MTTKRWKIVAGFTLLVLGPMVSIAQVPGVAPSKNWDLDGYIKYMVSYSLPDHQDNALDHLIHQRFNFEYRSEYGLSFNAGLRTRLFSGDSLEIPQYDDLIGYDAGYLDLNKNISSSQDVLMNSQFDRLYVDWRHDDWQARIGRSRINWAVNTIWNPNDVFNAYSIYDFDYEERAGTDAIIVNRKFGFAGGIYLVVNPNQDNELNSYAVRYFANVSGWDYQLITGKSGLDNVIGAGFATDWLGAGVRGEFTWFEPRRDHYNQRKLEQNKVLSLETDYSFTSERNWLVRAAWLWIDNPVEISNAKLYLNLPLDAQTLSFTKNSAYAEVGVDVTPLSRLTFSSTYYDDDSYFIGISNSYSLANDWQLLTVLQRFDGSSNSLFGQTPATLLFANIRWSF